LVVIEFFLAKGKGAKGKGSSKGKGRERGKGSFRKGKGVIQGSFSGKQAARLRFLNSSSRAAWVMETRFQAELLRGALYPGGRPVRTPAGHGPFA
jgi:hypothetical protein